MLLSWAVNDSEFIVLKIARLLQTFSAIAFREIFGLVGGASPWVHKQRMANFPIFFIFTY